MQEKYRLKKNYQFNYIFKHGKSVAAKDLILIYAKNNSGRMKVGFSVGKKIGKAVVRNKTKRRLKECFRKEIPLVDKDFNYIFVPRGEIAESSYADIRKSVRYLLKKAGLYMPQNGGGSGT